MSNCSLRTWQGGRPLGVGSEDGSVRGSCLSLTRSPHQYEGQIMIANLPVDVGSYPQAGGHFSDRPAIRHQNGQISIGLNLMSCWIFFPPSINRQTWQLISRGPHTKRRLLSVLRHVTSMSIDNVTTTITSAIDDNRTAFVQLFFFPRRIKA